MINRKMKLAYPFRILAQLSRLPQYIDFFETRNREIDQQIGELAAEVKAIRQDVVHIEQRIFVLPSLDARLVALQEQIQNLKAPVSIGTSKIATIDNTLADNHDFDYFYKLFEDRFRGTEEAITSRVAEHVQHFTSLSSKVKKLPVVDIGCGRGEFLSVMKQHGFHAIGIDVNKAMVERAKKLGYNAEQTDAVTYLKKQPTGSLAAVTGFHLVEHLPFESLMHMFEQSYRTLSPGGIVLFETPNPEALMVGANTFYLDPSHQRPIPPTLLAFMLESVGFNPEIIKLHRVKPTPKGANPVIRELFEALYGPGDYAVVGHKL